MAHGKQEAIHQSMELSHACMKIDALVMIFAQNAAKAAQNGARRVSILQNTSSGNRVMFVKLTMPFSSILPPNTIFSTRTI